MAAQDTVSKLSVKSERPTGQGDRVTNTLPKINRKYQPTPSTADVAVDSSGYGSCSAQQLQSLEVKVGYARTQTRIRLRSFFPQSDQSATRQCNVMVGSSHHLRLSVEGTATDQVYRHHHHSISQQERLHLRNCTISCWS